MPRHFGESGVPVTPSRPVALRIPRSAAGPRSRPTKTPVCRLYTGGDLVRIRIILLGKRLGFSISEIGNLIDSNATSDPSGTVEDLGLSEDDIKERIELLTRQAKVIEDALAELRTSCVSDDRG